MPHRSLAALLAIAPALALAQPSSFSPCIDIQQTPPFDNGPAWEGFDSDTDFNADLVRPGPARVYFNSGDYQWIGSRDLTLGNDSTLVICGLASDPVRFIYPLDNFNQVHRISLGDNAELRISNLVIDQSSAPFSDTFISVGANSRVIIEDSTFSMRPTSPPEGLDTVLIEIGENSTLVMDNCIIENVAASPAIGFTIASQKGPGGDLTIIRANDAEEVTVTNTLFTNLRGGAGDNGDTGSRGRAGDSVPDAIVGNGLRGNNGGTGGSGLDARPGGEVIVFDLDGVQRTTIVQNVFIGVQGGPGGTGGRGGEGGRGSQGGDGAAGFTGGNGGRGGDGGRGGVGGKGGRGGQTTIFKIDEPPAPEFPGERQFIANNLAIDLRDGPRGSGGPGGGGGFAGAGGNGGTGVFNNGNDGSRGNLGGTGPTGAPGDVGLARFVEANRIPDASPARLGVHNNIVTFIDAPIGSNSTGPMIGIENNDPGAVDARNNIVSGANFVALGTFATSLGSVSNIPPNFIDAAGGDFRLAPGALGIDIALTFPLPEFIDADFDDNPRYRDDPTVANGSNSSLFGGLALDYGPFEGPGDDCPNELTGNGRVDAEDVLIAVDAVQAEMFDINTDLATDWFDLSQYLDEIDADQCD